MNRTLCIGLAVLLAIAFSAGIGQARGPVKKYCIQFAQSAVNLNNQNLRRGCGLSGGHWHSNFSAHKKWCFTVGIHRAEKVLHAEQNALRNCSGRRHGGATRSWCEKVARYSTKQFQKSLQYNCGFSGGGWHGNYSRHLSRCMRVGRQAAGAEMKARSQALSRCKGAEQMEPWPGGQPGQPGQPGGGGGWYPTERQSWCQQYAQRALMQVSRSNALGCGYRGGIWLFDNQFHYRWCMQVGSQAAEQVFRQRNLELQRCTGRWRR